MATNTPIPNMETDWHGYSGEQVQAFIKSQIGQTLSRLGSKVGHATYAGGRMTFFEKQGGTQLFSIELTGTNYIVYGNPSIPVNTTLLVLNTETEYLITVSPTTKQMQFGSTASEDYYEPYTYSVSIGNKQVGYGSIEIGGSASIDIRPHLSLSSTVYVSITINGTLSGQSTTLFYPATLTTMSFSCDHAWQNVWHEAQPYNITGIRFAGNLEKNIYVRIRNAEIGYDVTCISRDYADIEEVLAPSTTTFSLDEHIEAEALPTVSGIYDVELWMQAKNGGAKTKSVHTKFMFVNSADYGNISLICVNNQVSKAYNFREATLLEYAVYNIGEITTKIDADNNGITSNVLPSTTMEISGGVVYPIRANLKVETQTQTGVSLRVSLTADNAEYTATIPVDNTYAYISTPGYQFYLNPSANDNAGENSHKILNSVNGEYYEAEWNNFTFADDAWGADADGNTALVVKAGASLSIPNLKPLIAASGNNVTMEFMFRASNISDENAPILTCIDTEEVTDNSTGLVVYPTNIVLLSKQKKTVIYQQLPLTEDRIHHIAIVIQPQVDSVTQRGLAHIYLNGCDNVVFEFTADDAFVNNVTGAINNLRIGAGGTDTYLYMMRIYNSTALNSKQAFANYLNALIETVAINREEMKEKNNIDIEGAISYEKCKKAGLNCFIVQIEGDDDIPNVVNQKEYSDGVTISLEYGEHPEWNVTIKNTALDSQGTTSSKYYRHNLRSKVPKTAVWVYPNDPNLISTIGKEGYFDGEGNHPKVSKITWKKNVASQPQGHKMGATGMYNDIYKRVIGSSNLPSEDCRVAVYQHPFMGFQKISDGTYKFIGLYTGGPDKTDKKTFGYDKTDEYPSQMMIEGPDHFPTLTRFLVPWTSDVFYDWSEDNETLAIGTINGSKEGGWDADIVGDYSSDEEGDATNIYKLYETEFKPAYDAIYYLSPYIAHIADTGYASVDAINNDISNFRNSSTTITLADGTTRTHSNTLMSFFDDAYRIIYYYAPTQRYLTLDYSVHHMLAYLGLDTSGTYTTADIQAARASLWKNVVFQYVNEDEALYRQCFDEFIGASDNDAKNSYWRKVKSILEGGKWGFNEDDLDTIFQNDNNGQDTKAYYVEPDDTSDGVDIFQGRTSAFWYALRLHCKDEMRAMMKRIIDAMLAEGEAKGLFSSDVTTIHEQIYLVFKHYFWDSSAKYFPAVAYNADTKFSYIDVWLLDVTETYNGVPPLTQVHGDHFETEKAWVDKRIAYMFSKYRLGGFEVASNADGYGQISTTIKNAYDLVVTPAIWLYPRYAVGATATTDATSERTEAGDTYTISSSGQADTNIYIQGLHWLTDLGDLSGMELSPRSTGGDIIFTLNAKRLHRLKVGDADSTPVFNANTITLNSPSLEVFDARNVSSLKGSLSFQSCPRLREIYLSGTNVTAVQIPEGGREEVLELPANITTLALNKLNLLQEENFTLPDEAVANISTLYMENCDNINSINTLARIYNASGGTHPTNIGIVWRGTQVNTDPQNVVIIGDIAKRAGQEGGFFGCVWNNGSAQNTSDNPNIQGIWDCTSHPVYESDVQAIMAKLPLQIRYNPDNLYFEFEDKLVQSRVARYWGDKVGVFEEKIPTITTMNDTPFKGTAIVTFDEFELFTGLTEIRKIIRYTNGVSTYTGVFQSCTSLTSIVIPESVTSIGGYAFRSCPSLTSIVIPESVTSIGDYAFGYCSGLTSIEIPDSVTSIAEYAFGYCSGLTSIEIGNSVKSIGTYAFAYCSNLKYVICNAEQVPTLNSTNAFGNTNSSFFIFVPDASVSAYQGATNWATYAARIKPLSEFNEADYQ